MNFKCSFNSNHFVCSEPLLLKCNPNLSACKKCILKECDYSGIFKCPLCNEEHKYEQVVPLDFKERFKNDLNILSFDVLSKANRQKNELKEKLNLQNRGRILRNFVKFIEQDMIIRVESLKFELDKLENDMLAKIEKYRQSQAKLILKLNQNLSKKKQKIQEFKMQINKTNLDKCKLIERIISSLLKFPKDKTNFSSTIKSSWRNDLSLPIGSMIGYLFGAVCQNSLEKSLKNEPRISIIDLSVFIKTACGLAEIYNSNERGQNKNVLALTDFASNDFKLIRKIDSYQLRELDIISIDKFRLNKFKCFYAICSDFDLNNFTNSETKSDYGSIYACDMELLRILIFNSNMTKLKRIINGIYDEKTKTLNEFQCPRDICYFDERVYVLDQEKDTVFIFSRQGDYIGDFCFNEILKSSQYPEVIKHPWSVRVSKETIAIMDWSKEIYIFDFSFKLKWTIEIPTVLSMCIIGDYLYNSEYSMKIFFHCENGDFIGYKLGVSREKEPVLIFKKNYTSLRYRSEFMVFNSNRKFVISLGWAKSIALVSFTS